MNNDNDAASDGEQFQPSLEFLSMEEAIKHQALERDRMVMAQIEYKRSVDNLIDELSPEQAWVLYRMMVNISQEGTPLANQFAGQLHMLLRRIHHICAACGNKDHSAEEHLLGDPNCAPPPADSETPASGDDIDDDSEAIMILHNVTVVDGGPRVQCNNCKTIYPSIESRTGQGAQCPACDSLGTLYGPGDEPNGQTH